MLGRLALALQRERLRCLRTDGRTHEPLGRRADQDLAGTGRLLQPCGDVDGIADDEGLAGPGDHLAGVHPDTYQQTEPRDGISHLDRGTHRAKRVVLVDLREAEDRHHRVAHELLDRAAVPLEDLAKFRVVAGHEVA